MAHPVGHKLFSSQQHVTLAVFTSSFIKPNVIKKVKYIVILDPLHLQRRKIINGMHPVGHKDRSEQYYVLTL